MQHRRTYYNNDMLAQKHIPSSSTSNKLITAPDHAIHCAYRHSHTIHCAYSHCHSHTRKPGNSDGDCTLSSRDHPNPGSSPASQHARCCSAANLNCTLSTRNHPNPGCSLASQYTHCCSAAKQPYAAASRTVEGNRNEFFPPTLPL